MSLQFNYSSPALSDKEISLNISRTEAIYNDTIGTHYN